MTDFTAEIRWSRGADAFTGSQYSRAHRWLFDGGVEVAASASPHSVPQFARVDAVDPEEALIAALASCHMLFFLAIASKRGFIVEEYVDRPVGVLARNDKGRFWMETITLRPEVVFAGAVPAEADLAAIHHQSHDLCYIANSVRSDVRVEPAAARTA